ncbi:MAG: DUF503 domain-containing protein [Anaerovoracaceae bacterium]|jgi:uncharacterized protein YlxP (DUF503 family)
MIVGIVKVKIHIPWAESLKDKRIVIRGICSKVRGRFNVSIAQVENQDIPKTAVLGFAFVTTDNRHADSVVDNVINFIESNVEGEVIKIERETWGC